MESQAEIGTFGLAFLLFIFGIATFVLPFAAVQMARARSAWFLFACGFLLFSLMIDLLCVTQLFGLTLPYRDHLIGGLLVAGFGLCCSIWPLVVFAKRFRRVTKIGSALLAILLLLAIIAGAVRVLDTILLWFVGGDLPGPVASTLHTGTWERPAFGLLAGMTLLVFSLVLATASTEPIRDRSEEGTLTGGFSGWSPGLRKLSKVLATAACFVAALYGFAVFSDAAFGTSFESWFHPVQRALETFDTIAGAWDFYMEWAGFLIVAGLSIWYAISEEQWGCLTAILAGLAVYLAWVISAGLLEDWGGPLRGAWQELVGWFQ